MADPLSPTQIRSSTIDPNLLPLLQWAAQAMQSNAQQNGTNLPMWGGPYSAGPSPIQQNALQAFQQMFSTSPRVDPGYYASAMSRMMGGDPAFSPGAGSVQSTQSPFQFAPWMSGGGGAGGASGAPSPTGYGGGGSMPQPSQTPGWYQPSSSAGTAPQAPPGTINSGGGPGSQLGTLPVGTGGGGGGLPPTPAGQGQDITPQFLQSLGLTQNAQGRWIDPGTGQDLTQVIQGFAPQAAPQSTAGMDMAPAPPGFIRDATGQLQPDHSGAAQGSAHNPLVHGTPTGGQQYSYQDGQGQNHTFHDYNEFSQFVQQDSGQPPAGYAPGGGFDQAHMQQIMQGWQQNFGANSPIFQRIQAINAGMPVEQADQMFPGAGQQSPAPPNPGGFTGQPPVPGFTNPDGTPWVPPAVGQGTGGPTGEQMGWNFTPVGGGAGGQPGSPVPMQGAGTPTGSFAQQLAGWDFEGMADPTLQAALAGQLKATTPTADNRMLPQIDQLLSQVLSGQTGGASSTAAGQAADAFGTAVSAPRFDTEPMMALARTQFNSQLDRRLADEKEAASRFGGTPLDTARMERLGRTAGEATTGFELGLQDLSRQSFENAENRRIAAIPLGRDITEMSEYGTNRAISALPAALAANEVPFRQQMDVATMIEDPALMRAFNAIMPGMARSELPFQRGFAVSEAAANRRAGAMPLLQQAEQAPFSRLMQMFGLGDVERQAADTGIARGMTEFGRTQGGMYDRIAQLLYGTPQQQIGYGPSPVSQIGNLIAGGMDFWNAIQGGGNQQGIPGQEYSPFR